MSAPTQAPAYPVRYDDTQAGKALAWIHRLTTPNRREDFHGSVELYGAAATKRAMREEIRRNA